LIFWIAPVGPSDRAVDRTSAHWRRLLVGGIVNVDRVALLVLPVAFLASTSATAQFVSSRWPPGTKEAAIAACRESILQQSEQDFLKRNNLKELPPGFREKSAQVMEPFLAVCGCAMDRIEKQWSFEYFASHQSEMIVKLNELTVGECAPLTQSAPAKAP
jgi:hypothetical protein